MERKIIQIQYKKPPAKKGSPQNTQNHIWIGPSKNFCLKWIETKTGVGLTLQKFISPAKLVIFYDRYWNDDFIHHVHKTLIIS